MIDIRLRQLSYSSLLTLHSCPRRFQLDKLQSESAAEDPESSVTFAFGHLVGEGIQMCFEGFSLPEIQFRLFCNWKPDLLAENPKQNKSFYLALFAVEKFYIMYKSGYMSDYELVYWEGKPATELSFRITTPDGFKYRGFVDCVLRHKETGEILVLELKTTSSTNLNPATYKNSAQAIGYSVVLDVLFPELSSYQVLYLVYTTKNYEYNPLPFEKSYLQRALWIRELLLDIETIKLYEGAGVYPMRGESCYDFYRECKYYGLCTLSTESLTEPYDPENAKVEEFQIELTLADLINSQLSKSEA